VGAVRDRGDDAIGASTTPSKSPEEVLVLVGVGDDVGPISSDDGELKGVVDACRLEGLKGRQDCIEICAGEG
jgi:hypothetical protein